MTGPEIIARTLSIPFAGKGGNWQYHPRSDHHSKVTCWVVLFDLLKNCEFLRRHVQEGKIGFGINHEIRDSRSDKKKDLDLVVCTPGFATIKKPRTFSALAAEYNIQLSPADREALASLPPFMESPVGNVLIALEAKAAMTAHQRALPRLHDELSSSHSIVHGHDQNSISAGLVLLNIADSFVSPLIAGGSPTVHKQSRDAQLVVDMVNARVQRRSSVGEAGFDAVGVIVAALRNDGSTVTLESAPPAPQPGQNLHYTTLIDRLCQRYRTRFSAL